MSATEFNLANGQRAERKTLITIAEWSDGSETPVREILGTRTEDSSIEYNPDVSVITDIRGVNYTDVNNTKPQQDFDPFLIMGGSKLAVKLNDIRRRNALSELGGFTVYVITTFLGASGAYEAEKHTGCTITYNSIGGDTNVNMPISVYLSNDCDGTGAPQVGTVDSLGPAFKFTPMVNV